LGGKGTNGALRGENDHLLLRRTVAGGIPFFSEGREKTIDQKDTNQGRFRQKVREKCKDVHRRNSARSHAPPQRKEWETPGKEIQSPEKGREWQERARMGGGLQSKGERNRIRRGRTSLKKREKRKTNQKNKIESKLGKGSGVLVAMRKKKKWVKSFFWTGKNRRSL